MNSLTNVTLETDITEKIEALYVANVEKNAFG